MSENKTNVRSFTEKVFSAEENSAANIGSERLGKYNRTAVKMFHTPVLTSKETLFPGIGQFAEKMLWGLEVYRTLYFVNVLKIDMLYVTIILTLIGIYDVLNNPIVGIAYDRTRTRWGKARPYVMLTVIPFYLSSAVLYCGALFLGDRPGDDPKKIIFVFVMLFIQGTFSTAYKIPRDNMTSLMSANPKDRINVGLVSQYVGEIGSQLIYMVFIPLMEMSNKGVLNVSMSGVFAVMAVFSSTIGTIGNMAMAIGCKERILLQPKPASSTKSLFFVLKNKYMLRNFIANFSVSWWSNGGYSWDVVTQQEILGGTIPTFIAYLPYNILDYASVGLIPKFQKIFKGNNRNALLALRAWDLVSLCGMIALGCPFIENQWAMVAIFAFFHGLNGLNNGPANVFEAEVGREINDYTEYVTGERPEGSIGLLTTLITKVTSPINAILTVALFKWSGYDSTLPMLPWQQGSKLVYQKVFFLFYGVELLPRIIKAVPYLFYDLVGDKREKMYVELNERRALLANEDKANEELESVMKFIEETEAKA